MKKINFEDNMLFRNVLDINPSRISRLNDQHFDLVVPHLSNLMQATIPFKKKVVVNDNCNAKLFVDRLTSGSNITVNTHVINFSNVDRYETILNSISHLANHGSYSVSIIKGGESKDIPLHQRQIAEFLSSLKEPSVDLIKRIYTGLFSIQEDISPDLRGRVLSNIGMDGIDTNLLPLSTSELICVSRLMGMRPLVILDNRIDKETSSFFSREDISIVQISTTYEDIKSTGHFAILPKESIGYSLFNPYSNIILMTRGFKYFADNDFDISIMDLCTSTVRDTICDDKVVADFNRFFTDFNEHLSGKKSCCYSRYFDLDMVSKVVLTIISAYMSYKNSSIDKDKCFNHIFYEVFSDEKESRNCSFMNRGYLVPMLDANEFILTDEELIEMSDFAEDIGLNNEEPSKENINSDDGEDSPVDNSFNDDDIEIPVEDMVIAEDNYSTERNTSSSAMLYFITFFCAMFFFIVIALT